MPYTKPYGKKCRRCKKLWARQEIFTDINVSVGVYCDHCYKGVLNLLKRLENQAIANRNGDVVHARSDMI